MWWKVLVWAVAIVNIGWGIVALVRPRPLLRIVGFATERNSAIGEFRAVFGGLVLALGVVMILGLSSPDGPAWFRMLAIGFTALAVGRVISLPADGWETYTLLALLGEAGVAVLSWYVAGVL